MTAQKTSRLCRDRCYSTREPRYQYAHRRSDRTFPLNRRRRSRCIKQMARGVAHFGSKFLCVGVGNQKIEGTFDVRNVTKPIVAAWQVTDKGQGVWLSGNGGYILDMRSEKKIERLPGESSFIELKKQEGE